MKNTLLKVFTSLFFNFFTDGEGDKSTAMRKITVCTSYPLFIMLSFVSSDYLVTKKLLY